MNVQQAHIREIRACMNRAKLSGWDIVRRHEERMALYHMGAIYGYCAAVSAWDADWYAAAKNEAKFLMYTYRKDTK